MKRKPWLLLLLLSGIVFGSMPGLIAFCKTQGANNALILISRFLMLALITLPLALRDGDLGRAFRNNFKTVILLIIAEGFTPLLLYIAYEQMATGLVTTVHFLYPVIVVVWCFIVYREKLSGGKLLCLVLSIAGIALTMDIGNGRVSFIGFAIAFLSAITYSAYIVWIGKSDMRDITSFQLAFFVGAGSLIIAFIYGLVTGSFSGLGEITAYGWLSMAALGLIIAAGGSLAFIIGARHVDAPVAAIAGTLDPFTSITVGVLILNEYMDLRIGAGCFLILAAAVLLPVFSMKKA